MVGLYTPDERNRSHLTSRVWVQHEFHGWRLKRVNDSNDSLPSSQTLLILTPIHDIHDRGWPDPHRKSTDTSDWLLRPGHRSLVLHWTCQPRSGTFNASCTTACLHVISCVQKRHSLAQHNDETQSRMLCRACQQFDASPTSSSPVTSSAHQLIC